MINNMSIINYSTSQIKNIWNKSLYEDEIIIDIREEPIELFDGFILDIHEFKKIEGLKGGII